jgi:hypothetical protein
MRESSDVREHPRTRCLVALETSHFGMKKPSYTSNAMTIFRNPDNVELEFFCRPQRSDADTHELQRATGPDHPYQRNIGILLRSETVAG